MLNRQIADALPRIHRIRRNRIRRTSLNAPSARPAMIPNRIIRLQLQIQHHFPQQKPRPLERMNQQRIFPHPAQPRPRRKLPLQHRPRVAYNSSPSEPSPSAARHVSPQPPFHRPQLPINHLVIIASPRIASDFPNSFLLSRSARHFLVVRQPNANNTLRPRKLFGDIHPLINPLGKIMHRAVLHVVDPPRVRFGTCGCFLRALRIPHQIESGLARHRLDRGGESVWSGDRHKSIISGTILLPAFVWIAIITSAPHFST